MRKLQTNCNYDSFRICWVAWNDWLVSSFPAPRKHHDSVRSVQDASDLLADLGSLIYLVIYRRERICSITNSLTMRQSNVIILLDFLFLGLQSSQNYFLCACLVTRLTYGSHASSSSLCAICSQQVGCHGSPSFSILCHSDTVSRMLVRYLSFTLTKEISWLENYHGFALIHHIGWDNSTVPIQNCCPAQLFVIQELSKFCFHVNISFRAASMSNFWFIR